VRKFSALLLWMTFSVYVNAQPVVLGTAGNFGVLAGSAVTNIGTTAIIGNLGVSPGTAVSGFPPGTVSGGTHIGSDPVAIQAQTDLTAAYLDAQGRPPGTVKAGDIGGQTLTPGTYTSSSTLGITGNVTLSGAGVYIFQIASGLTTASGSQVILAGGATADNVFWQVGSSATLGTGSTFNGNILAQASITITTSATLNGRALARTGAVTLDSNAVTSPGGSGPPGPPPPGPPTTPAPSSLILVAIGLALAALYVGRERLLRRLRRV
jgi:Ice-binding-like